MSDKKIQTDILLELVNGAILFYNSFELYAYIHSNNCKKIWPIRSKQFKRYLTFQYYLKTEKAPNSETFNAILNLLEAMATHQGHQYNLYNRVAWHEGTLWYDLSDDKWHAVKITSENWSVEEPPILFRRYQHQECQIIPKKGGGVKLFLDFVNLKNDQDKLLLLVYIVSCFIPDIPHPILVFHGSQGSSKSTLFMLIKSLVDPSLLKVLTFPKDINELIQKISHHWFCGFDNISTLSDWISDTLCRAVSGEGFSKRELYTNDEDVIYSLKRCIGLNGINVVATKPDLLDRCILLELVRISGKKRRTEAELWEAFNNVKPEILSGIFDILSRAMKIKPGLKLQMLPRMADFTQWGYAIAEALGYNGLEFLDVYYANIEAQNREAIAGSLVGEALLKFMEDIDNWEGTATELLVELEKVAEDMKISIKTRSWPKNGQSLSRKLNTLRTNFQEEGINFDVNHDGKKRILSITKAMENSVNCVNASESITTEANAITNAIHEGIKNNYVSDSVKTKNDLHSHAPNTTNATNAISRHSIERASTSTLKTKEKLGTCGICNKNIKDGEGILGPLGIGMIHDGCGYLPLELEILQDIPVFTGIDKMEHGPYRKGNMATIPTLNALALIKKRAAKRRSNHE